MKHSEFQTIPADRWRQLKGTIPKGKDCDRPHLVPLTDVARPFAAMDSFVRQTNLCPGEILIDGEWVTGYQFISVPESAGQDMLVLLNNQVEKIRTSERICA